MSSYRFSLSWQRQWNNCKISGPLRKSHSGPLLLERAPTYLTIQHRLHSVQHPSTMWTLIIYSSQCVSTRKLFCEIFTEEKFNAIILGPITSLHCGVCRVSSYASGPIVTWKISKPAISRTPMKYCLLFFVSNVLLQRPTSHRNILA